MHVHPIKHNIAGLQLKRLFIPMTQYDDAVVVNRVLRVFDVQPYQAESRARPFCTSGPAI